MIHNKLLLVIFILFTNTATINAKNNTADKFISYLREIKSVETDFIQKDSNGTESNGKLLIDKPHKFRCNYYPPFPLVIIGNKNYVSVYDYDMEQISRIKPKENIFNFLLEDDIDFEKHFNFESMFDDGKTLKFNIYHPLSERKTIITFNKETKELQKMEVIEEDNIITLTFAKINKVEEFSEDLFKIKNPDIFGPPDRLNKTDIEKKYKLAS